MANVEALLKAMGRFLVWLCGCEHPSLRCDIPANVRRHVFWHQHHGKFHRVGNALDAGFACGADIEWRRIAQTGPMQ